MKRGGSWRVRTTAMLGATICRYALCLVLDALKKNKNLRLGSLPSVNRWILSFAIPGCCTPIEYPKTNITNVTLDEVIEPKGRSLLSRPDCEVQLAIRHELRKPIGPEVVSATVIASAYRYPSGILLAHETGAKVSDADRHCDA